MDLIKSCSDCDSHNLIEDREDQLVCGDCGLVLIHGNLCFEPEWRMRFSDENDPHGGGGDRARVGDCFNTHLTTSIGAHRSGSGSGMGTAEGCRLKKMHTRMNAETLGTSAGLMIILQLLDQACTLLELPDAVLYTSRSMASDFYKICDVRGTQRQESVASACIYFSCFGMVGGTRTIEEIYPIVAACSCRIHPSNTLQQPNSKATSTSASDAASDGTLYKMVQMVYEKLLQTCPGTYKHLLQLPERNIAGDTVRRLISNFDMITSDQRQGVYRITMRFRDALAQDPRLAASDPNVLNLVFIYTACVIQKIPNLQQSTFCIQANISTATLIHKQNAIKAILDSDPPLIGKILRA